MLRQAEEDLERKYHLKTDGYDFNMVVARVAYLIDLKCEDVLSPGKYKKAVQTRSIVCFWAVRKLGIGQGVLAKKFEISQPAISLAIKRGEKLVNFYNFSLIDT